MKMAQQEKKVSFGFSKIIRKPKLNIQAGVCNQKKIDYIKCVDDKSIKVIGEDEEKKDKLLIIPMLGSKSWHDRIVNKINANIHEDIKDKKKEVINDKNIKVLRQNSNNSSLDEQAAREIVQDLENEQVQRKNESLVIDQVSNLPLESQEPTLENYEEIPIEKFGIAMLRGMGWNPDKGIGKNAQIVKSVLPILRPKGIGLGADKIFQRNSRNSITNDIKLKLEKGSYVKIVAGNLCNNYGIIESFDDNSGRIIIKLAPTDKIVSLNEILVQPITKTFYEKNSRVINAFMYEKDKNDMIGETAKYEESSSLNKSERDVDNHVKNNKISMARENYRKSSSSNYDDDSGNGNGEKSSKRIHLKKNKKTYDSKRHRKSSGSHQKVEKKNHKKEKKRHKDEQYELYKYKQSRSRTNRG